MGRGIGAHANKVLEDEHAVIYEYGGYNLNEPEYRNADRIYDGTIRIRRECFVKPEIHGKLKKMPGGGKRLIVKKIPVRVHYDKMLQDGLIKVVNCSNCWRVTEDDLRVDAMACHLLFNIFQQYQEDGEIPEMFSYNV